MKKEKKNWKKPELKIIDLKSETLGGPRQKHKENPQYQPRAS
jgi:hypothetical protein